MIKRCILFCLAISLGTFAAFGDGTNYAPMVSEGQTFIHDPSTVIRDGTNYFVFGTGQGIRTKSSPDLIYWDSGDPVFSTSPAWTQVLVPAFEGHFWAPDIIRVNGKFLLYYAVSTLGKQVSAIGLASNDTLNWNAPNYHWTDCGPVIASTNGPTRFSYHYYDADTHGRSRLAIGTIDWSSGWPVATNSP